MFASAVLLGLTDTRTVKKTCTLGTKATGRGARDALEPLDTFQAATFRSAVGLIGYIVLDRPDCQYAAKAVRKCYWRAYEARLDAKDASGHVWHTANSDGSIRRRMCLRNTWCAETRKSTTGAFEQFWAASHRIQLLD